MQKWLEVQCAYGNISIVIFMIEPVLVLFLSVFCTIRHAVDGPPP